MDGRHRRTAVVGLGAAMSILVIAVVAVYLYRSFTSPLPVGGTAPLSVGYADPTPGGRPPATARSVVLITIDTLRADRVGAYGWPSARTPALDDLARHGVRFTRAFAAAPITLPSHASLMTGLYPPGHGSRHNGMRMRADVTTLAIVLQARHWATGAFVAAFPLDRRFGLDRGFDRYGDQMPRDGDGRQLNERPGFAVVDEALAWLGQVGDRPVFLWVHLFEPHAPYEPDPGRGAAGWDLPASARYDAEVARADAAVARLLSGLGARLPSTLIIVAGDHGEAFGEHGEMTHSHFLYDTTLQVPLILTGPAVTPRPNGVDDVVSLVDVFPTVIDALGLPTRDVDGVSLRPAMEGAGLAPRRLYAETFAPLLDFGWSSLRSVRSGSWKYIAAPTPELYDLVGDPGEIRNLDPDRHDVAREMAAQVTRYSGPELPATVAGDRVDGEARGRLGALGYVAPAPAGQSDSVRPDPKDRRVQAARMAQVASGELRGARLRAALEAIVAEEPRNGQAQVRLGYVLADAGAMRAAQTHFRAAIASAVPSADAHLGLAMCLVASGRNADAVRVLAEARRIEPGNPVFEANLGTLAMEAGDGLAAIASLTRAVEIDPDFHQARFNLVRALARVGRREDALRQAGELLTRLAPDAPQRPEVERLQRALR